MKKCHSCLNPLDLKHPVGRRDVCSFCGSDLRCCLNCAFYAPGSYNDCRESQAERMIEKGRSNFCDFFVFRDATSDIDTKKIRDSAKDRLADLFKKE